MIGAGLPVKKDGAYFGPRESFEKPDTKSFLRKSATEVVSPTNHTFKYTDVVKGPLPRRDERPVMGIHSNKNFITANAVEAILQGNLFRKMFLWHLIIF